MAWVPRRAPVPGQAQGGLAASSHVKFGDCGGAAAQGVVLPQLIRRLPEGRCRGQSGGRAGQLVVTGTSPRGVVVIVAVADRGGEGGANDMKRSAGGSTPAPAGE